jgi:hypothetical protein
MKKLISALGFLIVLNITCVQAQDAPVNTIGSVNSPGITAIVPITVQDFTDIQSCNLKILYNQSIAALSNVTIGPNVAPHGSLIFNIATPGEVTFNWTGNPYVSLQDDDVAFYLHFNKVALGTTLLSFLDDNNSNSCVFYDKDFTLLNDDPASTFYINGSLTFEQQISPVTTIPYVEGCIGETVSFPVTVENFNNIGAASFVIQYDQTVLSNPVFTNTSNAIPFSSYLGNPGIVSLSGFSSAQFGVTLPDNTVLFTLTFTYLGGTADIEFDHTYDINCQYGGAPPFFEALYDNPKSLYFNNGGATCESIKPVLSTTAISGDLGCNPTVVAPEFTGTDNCDDPVVPVVTTTGPSNTGCAYTQTWNANYTDACGNIADQISITYTWTVDTEKPLLATTATSGDLGCNPTVVAPVFTGTDNCDVPVVPVVTNTGPSNTGCAYTQTWNANYTDACGNIADQVSITYTWTVDTEKPVLATTATSGDLGCNPTVVAPVFTGIDNCDVPVVPVVTTLGPVNTTGCQWSQTWNANYTDACGNIADQVSITYTWTVDTVKPVLSTATTSSDLGCNPTVVAPVFTGTDNCDDPVVPVVTTLGQVNATGCQWSQTWNANYTDACGNIADQVSITYTWTVDTVKPVLSTTATSGDLGCNPTVVAPVLTGIDNCDDPVVPVVTTTGPSNTGCAYTQTWFANYTDACGNIADEISITYTWTIDTEEPVLSTTATSGDLGCNPTVVAPVLTGTDNCDVPVVPVVTTTGPSNTGCAYTQTWNANYTDACGNIADQVSITYTWTVDNEKPVLATTATSGDLGCNPTVVVPVLTGIDNCDDPVVPVVTTTGPSNTGCAYTQTWDANYTDACGNIADQISITYTWTVDTVKPVLSTTAISGDLGCNPTSIDTPVFTGSDNCDASVVPVVTTTGPSNTGCAYTQTWFANYTDACGNIADEISITYTWTIDTEEPVLSTTATSGDLGCNPTSIDTPVFTGTDNCDAPVVPVVTTTGPSNTGCAYTQTWFANYTDACGNIADEISITYTWTVDTVKPVLSTTAISGDLGCNPTVIAPVFTGTDNCDDPVVPVVTTTGPSNTGCAYTQTWDANYTDACGNVADQISITYTWTVDTVNPVIGNIPSNIQVFNDPGNCSASVSWISPTANDNCGISSFTGSHSPGDIFPVGATTVTYTATDICGNFHSESFNITVIDNEKPVIYDIPSNIQVYNDPGNCSAIVSWTSPTADDNCGISSFTTTHSPGVTFPVGITTVTYTATDIYGNSHSESFDVTVIDNEKPVIQNMPQDIEVNNDIGLCSAVVTWTEPTASDNCQMLSLESNYPSGYAFPVGTTIVTYTATDIYNNVQTETFSVKVNDTENPTITCPGNISVNTDPGVCEAIVNYTAPVGTDNCPGANTVQIAGLASGSAFPPGTTANTFRVTDAAGNTAECSFTVTVIDNEPPVFVSCNGDIEVDNEPGLCHAVVSFATPVATDNCTGVVVTQIAGLPSGSEFPVGTTEIIFEATDNSGNTSECSFFIIVNDTEDPVITCPADVVVNAAIGTCSQFVTFALIATDNCPGVTFQQTAGLTSATLYPVGTTTNTFVATDASGNTATCSFTVTVIDAEVPEINCPGNISVNVAAGTCGAIVNYATPSGTDNCPGAVTIQTAGLPSGAVFPIGVTLNTFKVTDAAGLTAECSFTVTVDDNELPVITCATPATSYSADAGTCTYTLTGTDLDPLSFGDNCPGASIFNNINNGTTLQGETFQAGTTTVTWTVTDASNNVATCQQNIIVVDVQIPVITLIGSDTVFICQYESYSDSGATALDNCDGNISNNIVVQNNVNTLISGTYSVTYNVDDAANNSAIEVIRSVIVREEPMISFGFNGVEAGYNADFEYCFNTPVGVTLFAVYGGTPPFEVTYTINGGSPETAVNLYPGSEIVATQTYTPGVYNIVVTGITDANGCNAGQSFLDLCTASITILNEVLLYCPADITVNNDPGLCGATVEFEAFAGGTPKPDIIYTLAGQVIYPDTDPNAPPLDPVPSYFFPAGINVVEVIAMNICDTLTCSFTVTVIDVEVPEITCPTTAAFYPADNGSCFYTVQGNTFDPVAFSDNCPNPIVVNDFNYAGTLDGAEFPVGMTEVVWMISDAANNMQTCTIVVNVTDIQSPEILCIQNQERGTDQNLCSYTVSGNEFDLISYYDNCAVATVEYELTGATIINGANSLNGILLGKGITTVLWTVTDIYSNSETCSFEIDVKDFEPPVISVLGNNPDTICLFDIYIDAGAEAIDNCDGDITAGIVTENLVNTSTLGNYSVTYSVLDAQGNSSLSVRYVEVISCGFSLSGKYVYHNVSESPLENVQIMLVNEYGDTSYIGSTDIDGDYFFPYVAYGEYDVISEYAAPVGGAVNSLDAGMVNAWQIGPQYPIEKVRYKAADVNVPFNLLNAGDAGMILSNFLTMGGTVWAHPVGLWSFWKANDLISVNSFTDGTYPKILIDPNGTDVIQNFYGVVTGDFNLSHSVGGNKSLGSLSLEESETVWVSPGEEVLLPFLAGSEMTVGAISLILNYPVDLIEIQGVYLGGDMTKPIQYNLINNQIRIGWFSNDPLHFNEEHNVFSLLVKVNSDISTDQIVSFALENDPLNELGNEYFDVIYNAVLLAGNIKVSLSEISEHLISQSVRVNTYPNPASEAVSVNYVLPFEGTVTIEITDLLGRMIGYYTESNKSGGNHLLNLDITDWSNGLYYISVILERNSVIQKGVNKMLIQK